MLTKFIKEFWISGMDFRSLNLCAVIVKKEREVVIDISNLSLPKPEDVPFFVIVNLLKTNNIKGSRRQDVVAP